MIDHIEEPLFSSCVACQTDLLGTTLWRSGLGKIDECKISPIDCINSPKSVTPTGSGQPSLTVLLRDRRRDPRWHRGVSHGGVV